MVGTVTISVEVELGWGYHDVENQHRYESFSDRRERETETLTRFLDRLDEFDIPISFDVVGHLLLEECTGNHEGPYPEDWFSEDPGTDRDTDPLFYAPDLVDAIDTAEADHEICTHTFSHVLCDEISEETLRNELLTSKNLHKERLGNEPRSIVTPRHRDVSRTVLRECGIDVIRVPANDLPEGRLARFWHYLFDQHPVVDPARKEGVVETYTSTAMSLTAHHLPNGQRQPHPAFRVIPKRFRQRLHRRYLNNALRRVIEQDSHIHLWTHLYDLANDSQWTAVSTFLTSLGDAVSSDEVRIATMAELTTKPYMGGNS